MPVKIKTKRVWGEPGNQVRAGETCHYQPNGKKCAIPCQIVAFPWWLVPKNHVPIILNCDGLNPDEEVCDISMVPIEKISGRHQRNSFAGDGE